MEAILLPLLHRRFRSTARLLWADAVKMGDGYFYNP